MMDSFIKSKEKTEWPEKEGFWWFYGYRYGRFFGKQECEKELIFCRVFKISNGLMIFGDGQAFSRCEVEDAAFIPATLPELPNSEQVLP